VLVVINKMIVGDKRREKGKIPNRKEVSFLGSKTRLKTIRMGEDESVVATSGER